ncbi:MAG: hypothetical protein WD904_04675 [Dehalococcoidia bacterium]
MAQSKLFRQSVAAIDLSIQRATPDVPDDGWFYVVFQGLIKGRFRQKKQAEILYKGILNETGYKPDPPAPSSRNEAVEGYLDEVENYWLDSHKHTRRGGKGRY